MPRGRFISKSISLDAKVDKLSTDRAKLLWTWMIPQIDVAGRLYGSAAIIRSVVFPRRPDISIEEIEVYLQEMHDLGLVVRYSVDGDQYLHFPNFAKHQVGLRPDRETPSIIPPWPGEARAQNNEGATPAQPPDIIPEEVQSKSGVAPEVVPPKLKLKSKSKSKLKSKLLQQPPDPPPRDTEFGQALTEYENNFGPLGSPHLYDRFQGLWDDYPVPEMHVYARSEMREAMLDPKRRVKPNLTYYARCLGTTAARDYVVEEDE